MHFGIIAEGKADQAVIINLLYGLELVESDGDYSLLRPLNTLDDTTLSKSEYQEMTADEFSSWTLVKKDCEVGEKFSEFFNDNPFGEEKYIIIQIDTAECELIGYDVLRPSKKMDDYCSLLREKVISRIKNWLDNKGLENQLFFAICIEEMDAWVHTLYENKDTSKPIDAKRVFRKCLVQKRQRDNKFKKKEQKLKNKSTYPVSYTHLTLPTILLV